MHRLLDMDVSQIEELFHHHPAVQTRSSGVGPLGAALCLQGEDGVILSLVTGERVKLTESEEARGGKGLAREWRRDTLCPIWSSGKGPAASVLLRALDREKMDLETPVHHVWPGLGVDVTFGQLLSHQAGLAALDVEIPVTDYDLAVISLERQAPAWEPGHGHGYHPRTWGFLIDECVRRIQGAPLGEVWRRDIAGPLGLDLWLGGLPEGEFDRVARVQAGPLVKKAGEEEFMKAFAAPQSLTRRSFSCLRGLNAISEFTTRAAWTLSQPAFTAVSSAEALAGFYGHLATGSGQIFSPRVLSWMRQTVVSGPDQVLLMPTAFSAGFQKDPLWPLEHAMAGRKQRSHYGTHPDAFGHPGAGGSLGFADPSRRLGFAFIPGLIMPGVMPAAETVELGRLATTD